MHCSKESGHIHPYPENLNEAECRSNGYFCLAGILKTGEHLSCVIVTAVYSCPSLQWREQIKGAKIKHENALFGWERRKLKIANSVSAEITATTLENSITKEQTYTFHQEVRKMSGGKKQFIYLNFYAIKMEIHLKMCLKGKSLD